jgi:hypothetical protein
MLCSLLDSLLGLRFLGQLSLPPRTVLLAFGSVEDSFLWNSESLSISIEEARSVRHAIVHFVCEGASIGIQLLWEPEAVYNPPVCGGQGPQSQRGVTVAKPK